MNITQDKLIEMADQAGFYVSGGFVMSPNNGHFTSEIRKLVDLVSANAIASMQGEPVARFIQHTDRFAIIKLGEIENGQLLYAAPSTVKSMQGEPLAQQPMKVSE